MCSGQAQVRAPCRELTRAAGMGWALDLLLSGELPPQWGRQSHLQALVFAVLSARPLHLGPRSQLQLSLLQKAFRTSQSRAERLTLDSSSDDQTAFT